MKKFSQIVSICSFCLVLFTGCTQQAYSQTYVNKKTANGKAKRLFDRAVTYNKNRLFDKAIKDFEGAIKAAPNFIDAHYQLAAIYFSLNNYEKAIKSLEKVVELDKNYKSQAFYFLGEAHWKTDDIAAAVSNFEQFLQSNNRSQKLKAKATKYVADGQFAIEAIKNPVPFHPQKLASTINTPLPEYLPSITAEGNTLVFTRRVRGDEEILMSKKIDNEWTEASPIEGMNTPEREGSIYISADGNLLVFNRFTRTSGSDLFFSEKIGDQWSKPQNIDTPINTRAWEAQPSLSPDGKTIYFASNRKGSLGGKDIWRSQKNEDGKWGNPVNLGTTINTTGNDEAPFFHPDGKTLYFMSEGHPGMGGYDLFMVKKGENGKWGTPKNLGYPINTKGNEGALFITLDGTTAYLTRDNLPEKETEKVNSRKQADLYTFELPKDLRPTPVTYVKATVKDAVTTKKLADAKVEVIDLATDQIISTSKTDRNGNFLTCLPMGGNYALNVNKTLYLFHSENFELLQTNSLQKPFLLKIKLQPIPLLIDISEKPTKVEPIILKNVFFESGSAKLKTISLVELNILKQLLEENDNLRIQINGHTDNVGSNEDNLQLSEDRAKEVAVYLIQEGIAPTRLEYKGYGESQPIDNNDTEAGRKNNRRTEFVIIQ